MLVNAKNIFCLLLFLCLAGGIVSGVYGQEKLPKEPPKVKDLPRPGAHPPGFFSKDGVTSERSILVDPSVTVKLCVAKGELRINGWRRNEVRVFVKHGRKFRLEERERSPVSGKPNWLWVGNIVEGRPAPAAECLAGEMIEIDAPIGASIDISGREVRTTVDSLKKVNVNILGGAVTLRNITGGIGAQTGRGDVMVENSAGAIDVSASTGNIVVADVKSGQIGDVLQAKTNSGAITMQNVYHRQIQASSISGSVYFDGKFLPGGIYSFRTSAGSIKLLLPGTTSCTLTATYGRGDFNSEIPHKIVTQDITPQAKVVVAKMGSGNATVNLRTTHGTIGIRKQPAPGLP